jgi:hypothetical protein
MPTYKLAPNIAATVDIKYLDIVGSKYGPQIRINGKVDGVDNYVYLPGNLADQLTQLISQGVIANQEYPLDVAEPAKVGVKPLKTRIQIALDQPAGQKHGTLKIVALSNGNGAGAPAPAGAVSSGAKFPPLANASAASGELPAATSAPAAPSDDALRAEKAKHALAMKQAVAYTLDNIEPLYRAKEIGLTGDEAYKHAFSIFQTWEDKGLVQ